MASSSLPLSHNRAVPFAALTLAPIRRLARYFVLGGIILVIYHFLTSTIPAFSDENKSIRLRESPSLQTSLVGVKLKPNVPRVLFAVSELEQMPVVMMNLACQMAQQSDYSVHIIALGLSQLPIQFIRAASGMAEGDCPVTIHDARAGRSSYDPADPRVTSEAIHSVARTIEVIRPASIFHVELDDEPEYMKEALGIVNERFRIPLAREGSESLNWISTLDPYAIQAWHMPKFEIIIHGASHLGSLLRLVDSLVEADYIQEPPRLTVHTHFTEAQEGKQLAERLSSWPPDRLNVQNHIQPYTVLQPFESWYPLSDKIFGVFLSAETELTPLWFHYVKLAILSSLYSENSKINASAGRIIGAFSLSRDGPQSSGSSQSSAVIRRIMDMNSTVITPHAFRSVHECLNAQLPSNYSREALSAEVNKCVKDSGFAVLHPMTSFCQSRAEDSAISLDEEEFLLRGITDISGWKEFVGDTL
ncbi:hypothetical protein SAICODRAFT_32537 [Saitoella complicata NRRL Y-17804]|nr:uncharacterized protein SAICODRAFT_32537 [Saitoella complicata NRRL Y-17804]ODQ56083.1 hypothetical protein SAICODRAFT_32537 [Saitoella complicata NRRL Y-17804]